MNTLRSPFHYKVCFPRDQTIYSAYFRSKSLPTLNSPFWHNRNRVQHNVSFNFPLVLSVLAHVCSIHEVQMATALLSVHFINLMLQRFCELIIVPRLCLSLAWGNKNIFYLLSLSHKYMLSFQEALQLMVHLCTISL